MFAKNRRAERNPVIIEGLKTKFSINKVEDFTHYEQQNIFLEGTGSMVLDRENKIAFACISPRTDIIIFNDFCTTMGYEGVSFFALDQNNKEIYHTNVMLSIGDKYVIICLESIKDEEKRREIIDIFLKSNKEIVEISYEQMNNFAGNMLQVKNHKGEQFLVMSSTAFRSLTNDQITTIRKYNEIIDSELDTIEKNGGGSARCMLAEVFLEVNKRN